ncbi:PPE family protein [Mycobacterium eburneum]|nr:PPE family protein [Mycobacterium eburneum]TDH56182.1 PPE family protein [Mycobacterium eburneum]
MTAPIWMASPPEVHSTLLSAGPGPGPLLAAAGAWSALSADYEATADELTAALAGVQAGAWQGPSAEQYVAAHGPYLSWLLDSAAKSTVAATQHETAAGAYTAALATMPTLGELAANHTIHGALVATNFFGMNTIPIALNEADYVRMWVQAAETMGTYHVISGSALAAVPATTPAPQIVNQNSQASTAQQQATTTAATTSSSSWQDQLAQWITDYNMGFADPLAKLFFPEGFPIQPMPLVNALTPLFSQIPGISPALASALAWNVFHNLMLVLAFAEVSPLLLAAAAPMALAATGAVGLAGLAGVAGVAGVAAVPVPPADLPAAAATPVPTGSALAPSAPAGIETTVSNGSTAPSSTAPSTATAAGGGPTGGGPGVGFGPSATNPLGAGMTDVSYAASASGLLSRTSASRRRSRSAAEPGSEDAAAPADKAATAAQARTRRRRKAGQRGYGDEFMDMNVEVDPDWEEPAAVGASDHGAGPLGFAGAAAKSGVAQAAGLATLAGGPFSDGPTTPMVPRSWSD